MSMVKDDQVDAFLSRVQREYYDRRDCQKEEEGQKEEQAKAGKGRRKSHCPHLFVNRPGSGARVVSLGRQINIL